MKGDKTVGGTRGLETLKVQGEQDKTGCTGREGSLRVSEH